MRFRIQRVQIGFESEPVQWCRSRVQGSNPLKGVELEPDPCTRIFSTYRRVIMSMNHPNKRLLNACYKRTLQAIKEKTRGKEKIWTMELRLSNLLSAAFHLGLDKAKIDDFTPLLFRGFSYLYRAALQRVYGTQNKIAETWPLLKKTGSERRKL